MEASHKVPKKKPNTQKPSLLVAPPTLFDPIFQGAVILLTTHKREGAMGFNIARQTSLRFYEMLETLSIKPKVPDRSVLVGGPVAKNSGFVLYEHPKNAPLGPGISISPKLSISPAKEILEAAAHGELPGKFELIIGYAGWAAGKLEEELNQGIWLHTHFQGDLAFDIPFGDRWRKSYENLGLSPMAFVQVPGGAQA